MGGIPPVNFTLAEVEEGALVAITGEDHPEVEVPKRREIADHAVCRVVVK